MQKQGLGSSAKSSAFFRIVCISHSLFYTIAQKKIQESKGPPPKRLLSSLANHLPAHATPMAPKHACYQALLPIMILYFVATCTINSFQSVLEALDREKPGTETTVNLLNFLLEPPNKNKLAQSYEHTEQRHNSSMTLCVSDDNGGQTISHQSILNPLLIWVNEQPSNQADKQAKKLHMHLYTHGIHIAGMPYADLHA